MFLKQLDIVGFKSFAERVSVEFVPGVTAVVGPNGSGKSNITDAIRWVLGEQSARSLRGAKMEDIIFAGSDSRKSLNVAEVSLTLNNEDQFLPIDYNEVSVTRRVYRSGESEFFINKQSCRLKDIVDLFMDSGLGREAFSIISQGKVEEILSSKAEDRRTIFEEAAGVLKYKNRKKKAEQKLTETQENLNRVEDIIFEIEGQLEPLKVQASLAKDYLEKKEQLEVNEVALTVHEIEELHQQWETFSQQFEQNKDKEMKLSVHINAVEAKLEENREASRVLEASIEQLQEVLLLASQELEKLEGKKDVLKERVKHANKNKEQLFQRLNDAKQKVEQYSQLLVKEEQKLKQYEDKVKETKFNVQQSEIRLDGLDINLDDNIELMKSEYIDKLNEEATIKNEINHYQLILNQQLQKKERLDKENQKYLDLRSEIQERKERIERQLEQKQSDLEDHVAAFREKKRELEKQKENYSNKESKLYQGYQYVQQFKSRKEVLEEMQDDYAGFFQGVKEVLKARDSHLSGVKGAIAELISVPNGYETAIEIALGSAMQHIVMDNEENARKAIQYLKKNRSGRATFLPLSVISGRKFSDTHKQLCSKHGAFIGIASELIEFHGQYKAVIDSLLGQVIIAKDLKGANALAQLINHRYRIVTLEGDVVNPGGAMTGGSIKQKNNSLLTRQRELDDLSIKLEDMEKKLQTLENEIKEGKKAISRDEDMLESMRSIGERLRFEQQNVSAELREVEVEAKNINERLALYDNDAKSTDDEKKQATEQLSILEERLVSIKASIKTLDDEIQTLSAKKQDEQASKETLQAEITHYKVLLAEQQERYLNQKEKFARLTTEYTEIQSTLKETNDDIQLLEEEMTSSSSGESKLVEQISLKQEDKSKTIELIKARRKERLELQNKLENMENELKELKRQSKQFSDLLKDEEVKINRLDVELDNRLEHLREEYMLTYEAAKEKYPMTLSPEDAKRKVKLIKREIDELGTVNIGAIEEYDRISERYEFLTSQRNDLLEAKETLHRVITEMDVEMKKRFEASFFAIKEHFEVVFSQLFGGGRADLLLTEPGDLLGTGVEIVAQPPGKKLQNLGLLSGGERALTAIALLFAILRVRPVPFCVLDEVEAALDEANVQRFALFLKQFSKETQFIVITHRKGTMEEADVLYGVTMQESGVSRMVSVRLEESKELVQ